VDLIKFGETLGRILPGIKTTLQLSGLAVGLAFALFVHFAKPGDNIALITAGSVGISLVIFGQLFHFLKDFEQRDRPKVFLWSFAVFCLFTLSLLIITLLLLRKPSMSISKHDPPPEVEAASHTRLAASQPTGPTDSASAKQIAVKDNGATPLPETGVVDNSADGPVGEVLTLPDRDAPRSVEYAFSVVNDVSTLKARLMYTVNSRRGLYPDADFHEAVSWGSPWLSFDIANPSNENLFFTSLKTEAVEIRLINDVILKVPNIDSALTDARLTLINEGWGRATHPILEIRFARPLEGDQYVVVGQKVFTLDTFDESAVVDLGPSLPPLSKWRHRSDFMPDERCSVDGYLEALGRLRYSDDMGIGRIETFRTIVSNCGGGGGNVFPSAYFNITLPYEKDGYPIYTTVSDCVAQKSADQLVVKLTTKRSAHFRLKFTLTATSGVTVENVADVDILVPRREYTSPYREGEFFKAANKDGCT
jgi:hypothetical protein